MRIAFLAAIVLLAAIFTLSCNSYEKEYVCGGAEYDPAAQKCDKDGSLLNPCGDAWHKPSLSEYYCFEGIVKEKEIYADPRDGKKYKTVAIGAQTWMAENLSYAADGSKCGNLDNSCVDFNTEICDKYGRLYDWAAALDVCPAGWHLPNDEEWTALTDYAGGTSIAGKKLKATSGWVIKNPQCSNVKLKPMSDYVMNDYIPCGFNGTDDYGFSALPGDMGYNDDSNHQNRCKFYMDLNYGYWWSTKEFTNSAAYYRSMWNASDGMVIFRTGKADFLSVRCVKDVPETDRLDN